MNFTSRTLLGLVPLLLLACGNGSADGGSANGSSSNGGSASGNGGGTNVQCSVSCFDNCLVCEGKTGPECAAECNSAAGGATGNGGATSTGNGGSVTTGGIQGNGGTTASGGTTGAGGTTAVTPQSLHFTMDPFSIPVGGEVYMCQDFPNPFGKDVDVLTSESIMTAGSHHMFAFRCYPGEILSCAPMPAGIQPCPGKGTEFHEFFHSAQTPDAVTTYPPGIGRYIGGTDTIRMMVHYLNTGTAAIQASVDLRVDYVDTSQVTAHAGGIFLNDANSLFKVIPGQSTVSRSYVMPGNIFLLGGASHMHMRGVGFLATTDANEIVYQGTQWDEPPPNVLNPPIAIPPNGSHINVACSYNNTTGQTFYFGDSALTNEMCIYSGVYYPAPGGGSIITAF